MKSIVEIGTSFFWMPVILPLIKTGRINLASIPAAPDAPFWAGATRFRMKPRLTLPMRSGLGLTAKTQSAKQLWTRRTRFRDKEPRRSGFLATNLTTDLHGKRSEFEEVV